MTDEVKVLQDNETWDLVRAPTDKDVKAGEWVRNVNLRASVQVDEYKARYVIKVFKQVEASGYFETFALTLYARDIQDSTSTISEAGSCDESLYIITAFLNSSIEEEVCQE